MILYLIAALLGLTVAAVVWVALTAVFVLEDE